MPSPQQNLELASKVMNRPLDSPAQSQVLSQQPSQSQGADPHDSIQQAIQSVQQAAQGVAQTRQKLFTADLKQQLKSELLSNPGIQQLIKLRGQKLNDVANQDLSVNGTPGITNPTQRGQLQLSQLGQLAQQASDISGQIYTAGSGIGSVLDRLQQSRQQENDIANQNFQTQQGLLNSIINASGEQRQQALLPGQLQGQMLQNAQAGQAITGTQPVTTSEKLNILNSQMQAGYLTPEQYQAQVDQLQNSPTPSPLAQAIMQHEGFGSPAAQTITQNNNPGALRSSPLAVGSRNGFAVFPTVQAGIQALEQDIAAKVSGNTRTGLGPNSSLLDFFKVYAPSGDNNNPLQYAQTVAKQLGLSVNSPLAQVVAQSAQTPAPSEPGGTPTFSQPAWNNYVQQFPDGVKYIDKNQIANLSDGEKSAISRQANQQGIHVIDANPTMAAVVGRMSQGSQAVDRMIAQLKKNPNTTALNMIPGHLLTRTFQADNSLVQHLYATDISTYLLRNSGAGESGGVSLGDIFPQPFESASKSIEKLQNIKGMLDQTKGIVEGNSSANKPQAAQKGKLSSGVSYTITP